jgi:hypothetical protein
MSSARRIATSSLALHAGAAARLRILTRTGRPDWTLRLYWSRAQLGDEERRVAGSRSYARSTVDAFASVDSPGCGVRYFRTSLTAIVWCTPARRPFTGYAAVARVLASYRRR